MKRCATRLFVSPVIVFLFTVLVTTGNTFPENYSSWTHSHIISLNTTGSGAKVEDTILNFPLLVRLDTEVFRYFSQTLPGGADIRFSKTDGTHLPYQIERWIDDTEGNDTAEIWVLLDTVYGNTPAQQFLMYWGKKSVVDSSRGTVVFDTAKDFRGVWHLDERVGPSGAKFADATALAYQADGVSITAASNTAGLIGSAQYLDGNADAIHIYSTALSGFKRFTFSFWVRTNANREGTSYSDNPSLLGFDITGYGADDFEFYTENGKLGFWCGLSGNVDNFWVSPLRIDDGEWHLIAASCNGSNIKLYCDGDYLSSGNDLESDGSALAPQTFALGAQIHNGINKYFHEGIYDEVVFSRNARSADWIKLCYESQKRDQGLVTIIPQARDLIMTEPEDTVAVVGQEVSFNLAADGEGTLVYIWQQFPAHALPDSIVSGTTLRLAPVVAADAGKQFRCIVLDDYGADTSRWALLTVIDTPHISVQPNDVSVAAGEAALFTLTVMDTARISYSWYKTGKTAVIGTEQSLRFGAVTVSDTGDYYCVVANKAGTVRSVTVHLAIEYQKPVASFGLTNSTGCTPLTVEFTDVSRGDIKSRYWIFGDGNVSSEKNPVHVYTASGRYPVTLIVQGPGGSDTMVYADTVWAYGECNKTVNSIVIGSLRYDSSSPSIGISWCIDSATLAGDAEIGVTWSLTTYPKDATGAVVISPLTRCTDTVIPLENPLAEDCIWYVALWLRMRGGTWLEPTAASQGTVRTDASLPDREIVTLFDPDGANDTIFAFNGKVRLWKDGSYSRVGSFTDTLDTVAFVTSPQGMVRAGLPFKFRNCHTSPPFYVGIKVDVPVAPWTLRDVHLYRDREGKYFVDYTTMVDSVNNIVYVKTGDLSGSFMAMIDTARPAAVSYGNILLPVRKVDEFSNIVDVIDNVVNVRWKFLYGSGSELPQLHNQGEIGQSGSVLTLAIPDTSSAISKESGLRALLVVDDGHNADTLDLSRSVYREKSDSLTTPAMAWIPVYATATLIDKSTETFMKQLLQYHDVKSYDNRVMRLYRWINCEGNRSLTEKWIEYDQHNTTLQSLFSFEPGRLFWLKTYDNVPLHLGNGYTLPLRDTLSIALPAGQWTDFGMPYRFGVRMEEIFGATGKGADSLLFYQWKRDKVSGTYALDPVYVPGLPGKSDRSISVDYISRGGYSIFNGDSRNVTLRIPPVPVVMAYGTAKKAQYDITAWSTKFVAQTDDHTVLPAVYLGYAAEIGERRYPVAPTFSPILLTVFDRTTSRQYGHYISEQAKDGLVQELLICNSSDSVRSLRYHLEEAGAFPKDYIASCYDATKRTWDTTGSVTLAANSSVSRWIVIGDAAFRQTFFSGISTGTFSLHPVRPNPSRSFVNIVYSVPFGMQEHCAITIYNLQGRRVWETDVEGLLGAGIHTVTWNGRDRSGLPVRSGLYIVQLVVRNMNGTVIERHERHATLLN